MTKPDISPEAVERFASSLDKNVQRLTGIPNAKSAEAEILRALRAELTHCQKSREAEVKALKAVIVRMDEVAPRADHTCNEPGITLSEAVRREMKAAGK